MRFPFEPLLSVCYAQADIESLNYSLVQSAETTNGRIWNDPANRVAPDWPAYGCRSVIPWNVSQMMSTDHKLPEVGFKVDDTWLTSLLLVGLPEMYKPMIMGLEASGTQIAADAVKANFLQDVKMSSATKTSFSDVAFYSQPNKARQKDKTAVECFKCKRLGHYASEWKRMI